MILIIALFSIVVLYIVEQSIYLKNWDKDFCVSLQFAGKNVAVGDVTSLKEVVSNEKKLPVLFIEVKFSAPATFIFDNIKNATKSDRYYCRNMFSVRGRQRISRTLDFKVTKRGYYTIKSVEVVTKDYFMTSQHGKSFSNEAELLVYPEKTDTSFFDPMYKSILGEILIRQRLETDPFMFRGIREYRPTDNMKYVNWKHSAQTGELLVNTYGTTANYQVCILLDGQAGSAIERDFILEKLISLTSSIARKFLVAGMPVSVISNFKYKRINDTEEKPVNVDFGYGKGHMEEVDYQLALIDTSIEVSSLGTNINEATASFGRDRLYLIISSNHTERLKKWLDTYSGKGINMYAVSAYTRNTLGEIRGKDKTVTDSRICFWEVNA